MRKITFAEKSFRYLPDDHGVLVTLEPFEGTGMKANSGRFSTMASRAKLAVALGVCPTLFPAGSAFADFARPEQKKACTPDVFGLEAIVR